MADNVTPKISTEVGKGLKWYNDSVTSNQIFTSPLNKLWRAAILARRATSKMSKDTSRETSPTFDKKNKHYAIEGSYSTAQKADPWTSQKIRGTKDEAKRHVTRTETSVTKTNEIMIYNFSTGEYIKLQNRPSEVNIDPNTSWSSVKSFGRNNSFQIYNGSEDTLSFDISWFAVKENREDVLSQCRKLESWSKADGYRSSPPVIGLIWGTSTIFDQHEFILTNASYKLSNFQDSYKGKDGMINDLFLLPNCANQKLTFKRVSYNNLTHSQINYI